MYGQYHLPRGKNPTLSCLIGFVSMDHEKQQNYSTIQYKWQFTGPSCRVLLCRKSEALAFRNLLVPFSYMWDIKLPGPRAIPEYSAEQPGWSTQSWRRRSNEQWGVKSQNCTFPRRTKQPLFHTSVRHHLKPCTSIASVSRGTRASPWYIMTRGTAWQAMLPHRLLGKITSFLLYFLRIGLLHGMHVVLGWEFNWLYLWWIVL